MSGMGTIEVRHVVLPITDVRLKAGGIEVTASLDCYAPMMLPGGEPMRVYDPDHNLVITGPGIEKDVWATPDEKREKPGTLTVVLPIGLA